VRSLAAVRAGGGTTVPSYDGTAYAKQVQDAVLDGLMTNDYQRPATSE
jgi:hypothetical protein